MDSVLKTNIDYIIKGIHDGKKRYLINGKSCSGKTRLANNLISIFNNKNLKPFIIKGNYFSNYFSLDLFNDYKIIKIPIENTKIIIDYTKENNIFIHPFPQSLAYKNIFKEHKYIEKNKNFSYNNNLLIIDDCENVNLIFYFILDRSLKIIFKNDEFFGGIHIILIGNSKVKTLYDNIFSSALYNNSKNIYKLFDILSINTVETKFTKTNYSLEYYNLYSFFLKEKIQNRSGILHENDKLFFKRRDVDIFRKDLKNQVYFSDDYQEIDNHNNDIIESYNVKKYKVIPTKLFKDENIEVKKIEYFNNFYKNKFKPMILFINMKVCFSYSIPELDIKRGQMGYIKKINFKKQVKDINKNLNLDKYIKNIIVEINGTRKEIYLKKITNNETNLNFLCLPINIGYCIHFKYLTRILKGNLILTKDTSIHVIESCINKINDIGFKNTSLLNCSNLFESTYTDTIKNDIKFQN